MTGEAEENGFEGLRGYDEAGSGFMSLLVLCSHVCLMPDTNPAVLRFTQPSESQMFK